MANKKADFKLEEGNVTEKPDMECRQLRNKLYCDSGVYTAEDAEGRKGKSRDGENWERCNDDIIEHPAHYCDGRKFEPKDVIWDWKLDFNLGNVVKYISRCGRKPDNSMIQDLKKARQYLDFEINFLESEGQ